jgi:class 3 adenylate cyclase
VVVDAEKTQLHRVAPLSLQLVVEAGPGDLRGRRFSLEKRELWLGRQADCDVVIPDPRVSRVHAVVVAGDAGPVLFHRSQTNPTWLNGSPVEEPAALADGDEIRLADGVCLRVDAPGQRRTAPPMGSLRHAMEARIQLEARIEQEYMRTGAFLDLDIADSHGLSGNESRPERVVVSFERFRSFALRELESHGGKFLNSNGDELLAYFGTADEAVGAARAILRGLRDWNSRENLLARAFRVRVGIHTGRAAIDVGSGVAYGQVVSCSGHLQKTAPLDGVRISEDTYRALERETAGFRPAGVLATAGLETWVLEV